MDASNEPPISDVDLHSESLVKGSDINHLQYNGIRFDKLSSEDLKGKEFKTVEESNAFYYAYTKAMGFDVRSDYKRFSVRKKDRMTSCRLVCSAQGKRREEYTNGKKMVRRLKKETRFNCPCLFKVSYCKEKNSYIVNDFITEHSHKLAETHESHLLRSHRSIHDAHLALATSMQRVSVKPCHTYEYIVDKAGGFSNVGFTIKDLYNKLDSRCREILLDGDAEAALAYMRGKVATDSKFFCKFSIDEDNRLANMFWRDSNSLLDYSCFGDVVLFDSTYKTNHYEKPLVLFVGSNNHLSTTVFGFALLMDETIETYTWVLEMFISSMNNKKPIAILTDGDEAMRKAIEVVLPGCPHRLCTWHIAKNVRSHLRNNKVFSEFMRCMWDKTTPDGFEQRWNDMVNTYGLHDKNWVKMMYEKRHKWAEAFISGHFFARMRSTQRCEGMNRYMKGYLKSGVKLFELIPALDRALLRLRNKVVEEDFRSNNFTHVLTTQLRNLEHHAATIFTDSVFEHVRKEIDRVGSLITSRCMPFGSSRLFFTSRYNSNSLQNDAWGEDESGKLIKWIARKGGYESQSIMLDGKGDSVIGRKHEIEEVITLQNDVQSMKSVIIRIEKAIIELGGVVKGIKDELFKAMKGDGKDVSIQGDQPNHKSKDTQGNQPNHDRKDTDVVDNDIYKENSQKLNARMTDFSPQTSNDIQNNESASCEIYSEDNSATTQHKKKYMNKKRCRTETASVEFNPINTRCAAERKPGQQISSPYVDIERKLDCLTAKLAHGRTTNVKSISGFRGPLNLDNDDVHLLSYVFEEYDDNFVVFKTTDDYLNRLDIRCLEPEKLVSNKLINDILGILRERRSSNWFYSTYFSVRAINAAKEGGDTLSKFATTAKKKYKTIFRFCVQLHDCDKIFIPILDDGTDPYHWFLMVVKIVSKKVEIWDTCPSDTRTIPRTDFVYHLLKALDMIFDSEIAACYDELWSFCSFTVFRPNSVPIQPNAFDCGIFMIKFMEDYENASKARNKYYSVNERLRIALTLLKYPQNVARRDIEEAIEQDVQETCPIRTKKTKTIQAKDTTVKPTNNMADNKTCVIKQEKNNQLVVKESMQTMQRRGPGRSRGAKNKPKKGTTNA